MELHTRAALTKELSRLSVEMAAALRPALLAPGPIRERAQALQQDEHAGGAFELWTDLLSRRAAVLWVLRSLYLRILEDRELTRPKRILDPEGEQLFAHLAPALGPTAYLRWAYRDLAGPQGGLPELFASQPAELVAVPDAMSRKLIDLWRSRDPDTGALRYRFDDERFDSRLMGDLYQDLDPVVKKRYALLQTPDFVLDFILDETLTPAVREWGVETVRVLDPACGSGHFLLAALQRLVAAQRELQPQRPIRAIVEGALTRVVGIDLNDYACALARARLVMTALELCRESEPSLDLASAAAFHPRVYCADALEQVEYEQQLDLAGIPASHQLSCGLLTPPEVRAALAPELRARFHVVVGNPPYITEKDPARRDYHRQKVGKRRRYISAAGKYSLGAPFTERMLDLAVKEGWVGEITADSFMKREFGKPLIEDVLAKRDLVKVVSTSGAYIPGHGTPTVILFARNRPRSTHPVRVVMGKRGEPGKPKDPAHGKVWTSIRELHATPGGESEFISVADVPRATMATHPWSIGGGGAAELKAELDARMQAKLGAHSTIGVGGMSNADDVYIGTQSSLSRLGIDSKFIRSLALGEEVRDWLHATEVAVYFPYTRALELERPQGTTLHGLWPYRSSLFSRAVFGGGDYRAAGRTWFEWHQVTVDRYRTPLSIAFAFKATHNHFVLDRGGKVFNRTAPVIKLPPGASEAQHLVLLGQLNSSVGEFWVKQVAQTMGSQGVNEGMKSEGWEQFFERDGGKLESFPLASTDHAVLEAFARMLDGLARARLDDSVEATLTSHAAMGAAALRAALEARRRRDLDKLFHMVGLQEELDWLCIQLYGVDPDVEVRAAKDVPPLQPGHRPFELALAREDAERREALARGEEPDEQPTAWFERHGWQPESSLDAVPEAHRRWVADRLERAASSRELGLLEQPTYKRRWYKPDHAAEEAAGFTRYLDDRVETWVKERKEPFTVAHVAAALRSDAAFLAVGELLTARKDFDVDALIATRLRAESVPNNKHHVFKPEGLKKRAEWERTWQAQHEEDAGKPVTPPVPPKYDRVDYQKGEYWTHRGKLDVPKERFIAFTEVPPLEDGAPLFGWAGWTPRERARALLGLDERLEAAGVPVPERYGVLYGVWFLLPYVAWESTSAAADLRADVTSLVGKEGVTDTLLEAWGAGFALSAPKKRTPKPGKGSEAPKASRAKRKKTVDPT